MRYRFNPPPNWPQSPTPGYQPPAGWAPPPEWGPPPPGWRVWVPVRSGWVHPAAIVGYVLAAIVLVSAVATTGPEGGEGAATSSSPSTTAVVDDERTEEPTDEPTDEASEEPPAEPTEYKAITQRQWRKIAKDPDAHIGKTIIVYGQVAQFDSATGVDTFLADAGGVRDSCSYGYCDYPTNTMLTGDEDRLAKLVEEDQFRAKVTVLGSIDYETQIGGETTVPLLQVDRVKVVG